MEYEEIKELKDKLGLSWKDYILHVTRSYYK